MTDDAVQMESMTTLFYKNLHTSEGVKNMEQVLDTVPHRVTPAMNEILNASYNEQEVKMPYFTCSRRRHQDLTATQLTFFSVIGMCAAMRSPRWF